jgi:hypothetical protein
MMTKDRVDAAANLPDGIHSGLRREKAYGAFFYLTAPCADGSGVRHLTRENVMDLRAPAGGVVVRLLISTDRELTELCDPSLQRF